MRTSSLLIALIFSVSVFLAGYEYATNVETNTIAHEELAIRQLSQQSIIKKKGFEDDLARHALFELASKTKHETEVASLEAQRQALEQERREYQNKYNARMQQRTADEERRKRELLEQNKKALEDEARKEKERQIAYESRIEESKKAAQRLRILAATAEKAGTTRRYLLATKLLFDINYNVENKTLTSEMALLWKEQYARLYNDPSLEFPDSIIRDAGSYIPAKTSMTLRETWYHFLDLVNKK